MISTDQRNAISGLICFRASLLTPDAGRAGARLPGMESNLKTWCYHTRARRDFCLIVLAARIQDEKLDRVTMRKQIAVSRNNFKAIIDEALQLDIINPLKCGQISATDYFFNLYFETYYAEWRLIDTDVSTCLANVFEELAGSFLYMDQSLATKKALSLAILSRAESVKSDRKIRLSKKAASGFSDLSTWVVSNTFNRDLLLLLMSASITGKFENVSSIMKKLNVSRNSAKASLKIGCDNNFFLKKESGYSCSSSALDTYLAWHIDVFRTYPDDLLSAFAIFHRSLLNK